MRKIEENMMKAIRDGRNWMEGNTRVVLAADAQFLGEQGKVYLHGNPIATIFSDGSIRAIPETFRNWPTPTTTSRLRAMGIGAYIKKGVPFIEGIAA